MSEGCGSTENRPVVREGETIRMCVTFPSNSDLTRAVRAYVGEVAMWAGQSERRVHDIRLAVSEAVANVVEHAYEESREKPVQITIDLTMNEKMVIAVRDWGRKVPPEMIKSRDLDDIQEGGLGVFLMSQLADGLRYNNDFEDGTELTLTFLLNKEETEEEAPSAENEAGALLLERINDPNVFRSILGMFDLLHAVEDPKEMLRGILKNLHAVVPFDQAMICLAGFDEVVVDIRSKVSVPFLEDLKYRLVDSVSLGHSLDVDPEDLSLDLSKIKFDLLVPPSADEKMDWVDLSALSVSGGAVGALALTLKNGQPPEEFVEILEMVKKQISVLLEVSRLYERKREEGDLHMGRLSTISEVGEVFSAQAGIDRILTLLLELTLGIADAEVGAIALLEGPKDDKQLITRIAWGLETNILDQLVLRDGKRLSDEVLQNGEPMVIPSLHEDPALDLSRLQVFLDSVAAFPLVFKEEQVGVLTVVNAPTDRLKSEPDIKAIAIIANLTAAAIVNARLYQESLAKERIENEVRLAGEIQQSLLPREIPARADITLAGLSIPARQIGGDYYDLFEIDADRFACFIADVSGKGVPAAMVTMITRSYLHVRKAEETDPARMLAYLNDLVSEDIADNKFVTALYSIWDRRTKTLSLSNAGHDPLLIYRAATGEIEQHDTDGLPLGIFAGGDYTVKELPLAPGDVVLFYTDGIPEALNAEGEQFGFERMTEAFKARVTGSAEEIVAGMKEALEGFVQKTLQHDDLTMALLKVLE